MFKLTSLNLNGIRSATSKGLEAWLDASRPDCICVQEVKAQQADVAGRFEQLAGLQGHFHFAEKKGYSGVGIYTRHEPSDVRIGYGSPEFDAEGRTLELRFDTPARKLSIISAYFPSGSSGDERQQAKFRFLEQFHPHLMHCHGEREFILCGDINIAHQQIDLKNWRSNQKNSGFAPRDHRRSLHLVEQPRPGLGQQRGVAAGLPPGQSCARRTRARRQHLQGAALLGPRAFDGGLRFGSLTSSDFSPGERNKCSAPRVYLHVTPDMSKEMP